MDKYIKAQDLIDRIYPVDPENDGSDGCTVVYKNLTLSSPEIEAIVEELPAADVAPVRHGRWIPSESDFDDDDTLFDVEDWCDWQCSVCHEDICYEDPMERRFLPKFCPNCGARMDKEDEHEAG